MSRYRVFLRSLPVFALLGCAGFDASPAPEPSSFERLASFLSHSEFNLPSSLRPCCAFGHSLGVEIVEVPVPVVEVQNVVDARYLGSHTYDGGLMSLRNSPRRGFLTTEVNGLVYTCRAGFVDVAHVRDYADWTAFLALRISRFLEKGLLIDIGNESGRRLVYVEAVDATTLRTLDRARLAVSLAGWLAYQISIWHEIATWYGHSATGVFSERASAFSPEDLYSNALGIELAKQILLDEPIASEADFNAAMNSAVHQRLTALGAVPPTSTIAAAHAVDGTWWDSRIRLPNPRLVLRRNFDLESPVVPWLVPKSARPPELEASCSGTEQRAQTIEVPNHEGSIVFSNHARFEILVDRKRLDADFPRLGEARWITQDELPVLVRAVRQANSERFGEGADAP